MELLSLLPKIVLQEAFECVWVQSIVYSHKSKNCTLFSLKVNVQNIKSGCIVQHYLLVGFQADVLGKLISGRKT